MGRYAIVGASNPIGAEIISQLHANPAVEQVLAIGDQDIGMQSSKTVFVQRQIHESPADLFLEYWIDGVIYLPGCASNLNALDKDAVSKSFAQFLEGCHRAGVLDLVIVSSAAIYGPNWEKPAPQAESSRFDGLRTGLNWVEALLVLEGMLSDFLVDHPEVRCAIARPCTVLDHGARSLLGVLLSQPVVLLPSPTAPIQLCHPIDLARSIITLLLSEAKGAYHIAPPDILGPDDIARALGQRQIRFLRASILAPLLERGSALGLDFANWKSQSLVYLTDPWLIDTQKTQEELGFSFQYSSLKTLTDFVQNNHGGGSERRRDKLLKMMTRRAKGLLAPKRIR